MEQVISAEGGRFFVLRIPTQNQFQAVQEQRRRLIGVEAMLAGTDATYLSPVEEVTQTENWDVDLYFSDGHMNEEGNRLLADYMIEQIFR